MFFNHKEQFVLANIAIGMLQAAYSEHIISEPQFNLYAQQCCETLGTNVSVINAGYSLNPFDLIRKMDDEKKTFVKTFLYDVLKKSENCDLAVHYFVYTLEQSGLVIDI